MVMRLHDRPGFANPARIRIVLAEKQMDDRVEYVSVDLIGAEHKQPAFLAKNPLGKIPVLELDDGTLIAECTAITEYLDNLDGRPILTGASPREKAMIHMMQRRAEAELMDGVDGYFHYATRGLGPDMQPYVSPDWTGRDAWGRRQGDRAVRAMAYFDEVLRTRPFVAGDAFSMADITVYAALAFARAARLARPEGSDSLTAWEARIADRPGVRNRTGQVFMDEDVRRFGR